MKCDAPLPGTEVTCQLEAGHQQECWSKYKIFYEFGIISWGEMTWTGPNNSLAAQLNLPKEQQDEPK